MTFSSRLILKSEFVYLQNRTFKACKLKLYYIKFAFVCLWLRIRIRTNYLDPDPSNDFGSYRIRIRNTDLCQALYSQKCKKFIILLLQADCLLARYLQLSTKEDPLVPSSQAEFRIRIRSVPTHWVTGSWSESWIRKWIQVCKKAILLRKSQWKTVAKYLFSLLWHEGKTNFPAVYYWYKFSKIQPGQNHSFCVVLVKNEAPELDPVK